MINKEMVEYYLDEDYNKWIANVIVDICNDENDIIHLKQEIYKAWQDHLESKVNNEWNEAIFNHKWTEYQTINNFTWWKMDR
mgnify:CR=1 FL=1